MISACYSYLRQVFLFTILLLLPAIACLADSQFDVGVPFIEDIVLQDLPSAAAVAFSPDNTKTFVAVKDGSIRVAVNGVLQSTPFLNMPDQVNNSTDRGLLAIAVDPQFGQGQGRDYIYFSYVLDFGSTLDSRDPRVSRVVRVTADSSRGYNVALPNSMVVLVGRNSTPQNTSPPSTNGAAASCMTGLNMGSDVLPVFDAPDPEPRTSNTPIEDCIPADYQSHTAGTLIFQEGALFASFGDGSNYNTATRAALRALLKDSLAGKILRIDPITGSGLPGNPFYDSNNPSSNRSRVWSYGVRNPFRITVNPADGQVFAGDVGSSNWEEVNAGKGANFGWPCFEGGVAPGYGTEGADTASLPSISYKNYDFCKHYYQLQQLGLGNLTRAFYSYAHPRDPETNADLGAAVTGVAFSYYTSAYDSVYPTPFKRGLFIADYAQKRIRYLTIDNNGRPTVRGFATETGTDYAPVQLVQNQVDHTIYALFIDLRNGRGQLRRFRYAGPNSPPRVVISSNPSVGTIPLTVTFRSDGTSDPDGQALLYDWDFGDGNHSSDPHPIHRYEQVGVFTAKLTVTEASAPFASSSRTLIIHTGTSPPKAIITAPIANSTYKVGDLISYAGYADYTPEPGSPPANLAWTIILHHNKHIHEVQKSSGTSGTFEVTEHADDTYFEICLSVDAGGDLRDEQCVPIVPLTTPYRFDSSPVGAPITYIDQDQEVLAPYIAHPVLGSKQTIVAAPIFAGRTFKKWENGDTTNARDFTVGAAPVTLTASYENQPPTASIIATPQQGRAPLAVRLDSSSSQDPEGVPLTYSWNFGDGSQNSSTAVVEHTFQQPGTYKVSVTVSDQLGAAAFADVVITVEPDPPTPTPTATNTETPTATNTETPTRTPTANNTPTATSTPTVTPSSIPTATIAPPEPTPTQEPTTPTAQPTNILTPATSSSNPLPVPRITMKRILATRPICGARKTPCLLRIAERYEIRGATNFDLASTSWKIAAVIEAPSGRTWKRVAQQISTAKSASVISTQLALKALKLRVGLYRVAFEIQSAASARMGRSSYQYFRVAT